MGFPSTHTLTATSALLTSAVQGLQCPLLTAQARVLSPAAGRPVHSAQCDEPKQVRQAAIEKELLAAHPLRTACSPRGQALGWGWKSSSTGLILALLPPSVGSEMPLELAAAALLWFSSGCYGYQGCRHFSVGL